MAPLVELKTEGLLDGQPSLPLVDKACCAVPPETAEPSETATAPDSIATMGINGADDVVPNMIIRQHPFSIALDAWALLVGSLAMVLAMHLLHPLLLQGLILVVPAALLVRNDYLNFLLLGPGGTPQTFVGYARLSSYHLFAVRDPLKAPTPDRTRLPSAGILQELPHRSGPRPKTAGLAPQRQLNQPASLECYVALKKAIESLARSDPENLCTGTSCVEKHGFAFFARHPITSWGHGEICHIHDADKSMHMCMHPDDIKEVLAKGWGERHPLGFKSSLREAPVPSTFTLVYAPRDENDVKIICKIIEAAAWYHTNRRIELRLPDKS